MEAPPRKRGRPPKHPKVASTDSPPPALLPHSNNNNHSTPNSPSSPADVEMVDRVVPPVDSRSGPRGRKKSSSVADKLDAPASAKPGAGASGSPSNRELSKSEADDVDSPVERLSSRRTKKPSLVHHNACSSSISLHRSSLSMLSVAGFSRNLSLSIVMICHPCEISPILCPICAVP